MSYMQSGPIVPTPRDTEQAASARRAIAAGRNVSMRELPPFAMRVLMEALEAAEAGNAVSIVSVASEVTPQQAAALLNVSRPFVVGLIEKGLLPARMVGSQHRLPLKDVLAYKEENRAKRRKALAELVALDQGLGIE